MRTCIIVDNMIIDDERGSGLDHDYEETDYSVEPLIQYRVSESLANVIQRDVETWGGFNWALVEYKGKSRLM